MKIFGMIESFIFVLFWSIRMEVVSNPPKNYLESKNKNISIVLVPGFLGKWAYYKPLLDKLSDAGYPIYLVKKLENNNKDIKISAEIVRDVIDSNNLKNVVILSHSKGGYIGKYILKNLNNDKSVLKMISISTPYSGINIAKLFPFKRFNEFSPNSGMIKIISSYSDINSDVVSINPHLNSLVWNKKGSYLEGAKNIKTKNSGHFKIANEREVAEIILKELKLITVPRGS